MPGRVGVVVFPGVNPFHLSVPWLVFGDTFDGQLDGGPSGERSSRYEVVTVSTAPGRLPTAAGYDLVVEDGLDRLADVDTVVVPTWEPDRDDDLHLLDALRAAHGRGARIVGLCLGAFPVAAAGLLDGRDCVTHWALVDELRRRHPAVDVRADVLWSDHGDVLTSAGAAAALDCCLHVVADDHGFAAASALGKLLVMAPHRAGNQAQFLPGTVLSTHAQDPLETAMLWARTHLRDPITLEQWSEQAAMSVRTFTRQFRRRTAAAPQQWLIRIRLDRARELLETTDHTIERIAAECGWSTATLMRLHFRQHLDTTPAEYRRAFTPRPSPRNLHLSAHPG